MNRILLFVAFWIGLSCSAKATNFWLSATGNITSGSAPPVTPGSVEAISHDIGTQSGSIYVWARPDSGKTLVNWSLRLLSSDPSILTFASSSVETLNPVLGNTGSPEFEDIARWEYVDEPIGNNASIDDIQGINIFQVNRTGIGIGPDSTGLPYNDPFYDSSNDAWLLAQIDYLLSGTPGQTNLFLQIGEFGINNLGESSSQTTAVFGALTDAPLNGETNRKQSSQTADAVINVSALASANFDADSDIDGFDYLNWQRGFGLTSATHDQGDADGNGIVNDLDFGIWEQQLGNPPPIAETFTVPEPSTLLLVLASSCPWLFLKKRNCASNANRWCCSGRYSAKSTLITCLQRPSRILLAFAIVTNSFWTTQNIHHCLAADVTSTWNGSGDGVNWSDAGNWTSIDFPNNGNGGFSFDAVISGATVTLDQNITIEGLDISSSTLNGASDLTLKGSSSLTSTFLVGTGTATIDTTGSMDIGSLALRQLLNNDGAVTLNSNSPVTYENGTFQNNGTYTANPTGSQLNRGTGGTNVFNNAGTFIKQGTGTTQFSVLTTGVTFNNSGLVDIQQGRLRLDSGGTHTGDFTIASGADMVFTGTHIFEGVRDISGPGTFFISGGTTSFNGTTAIDVFDFESGTVNGSGNITLEGASTWTKGTMSGTGQSTIAASGSLLLDGTNFDTHSLRRQLTLDGSASWTGGWIQFFDGAIQNNNTFTDSHTSGSITSAGGTNAFNNSGTYIKQTADATNFQSGVAFNNTGTLEVQNGFMSLLGGGTHTGSFIIDSGADLSLSGDHLFQGTNDVSGLGTMTIVSGTSTMDGTIAIDRLDFDSGTIDGLGTLTLEGASTWRNATMSGAGQTIVAVAGSLEFIGDQFATSTLRRQLTIDGTATWSGGWIGMNDGTIQNNGTFTDLGTGQAVSGTGGTNAFHNAGTYVKQGVNSTNFQNAIPFNNSGFVDIQGGTLGLISGGTHSGDFSIASGARLEFKGMHSFSGITDISGPGVFQIISESTSFNGTTTIDALDLSGGTLDGTGTVVLEGTSTWGNAIMSGAGQTTVAVGGTLEFTGDQFVTSTLSRQLTIEGTADWTGGWIGMNEGTIINNGTFTLIDPDGYINGTGGSNLFQNNGTFIRQGVGTTYIQNGVLFNNSGVVDIQGGTLNLISGGTHTGNFSLAASTTLGLTGVHSFPTGTTISGTGTLQVVGGATTVTFDGVSSIGALDFSQGIIDGSGDLTINGTSIWTAGTMSGSGTTIVSATGSLEFAGDNFITRPLNRQITIEGAATWSGGWFLATGGSIQNNGTFTADHSTGVFTSGGGTNAFQNAGTFTKVSGNTTEFRDGVSFDNSGTVDVQAGTLWLDGGGNHSGNFAVAASANLDLDGVHIFSGVSNITGLGTLSNFDTVEIQGGTLNIAPTVTQMSGSNLLASTWKVLSNSTLNITSGSNITTSAASVTIDGAGSSFAKINTLVNNSGSFNISGGYDFTATGAFSNSGTMTIGSGSTFTAASGFTQSPGAVLLGSGTLEGNLTNSGSIRPGASPGILTIDGDLTLTPTSTLEIEVGGLTPGTQHDKVIVTGTASLDGRLDIPILSGFTPAVNDEVTFLTASLITGKFATVRSIGLEAANPNIAIDLIQSDTDVKMVFVAPETDINFAATGVTADWASTSTWTTGTVPETENEIVIDNLAAGAQRVDIQSDDAYVHHLTLASTSNKVTVGITSGMSLSAIVGAEIGDQAIVELDTGTIVTSTLDVQEGGKLSGNGTIVGTLMVGDGGSAAATLSPGFSVGHIDVEGNYEQQSNGELMIDVEGTNPGEYDTIDITGEATLGGTIEFMVDSMASIPVGSVINLVTADTVTGTFDSVVTTGVEDIFLAPIYSPGVASAGVFEEGDMDPSVPGLGEEDAIAFALGLTDPDAYESLYGIEAAESGDIDDDFDIDFDDIDDFVALLNGSLAGGMTIERMMEIIQAAQAVPEPSGIAMSLVGFLLMWSRRRRQHCLTI